MSPLLKPSPLLAHRVGWTGLSFLVAGAGLFLLWLGLTPLIWVAPAYADDPAFNDERLFGASTDPTESLVVGDMDNDGDLDLIVGNDQVRSAVYLNDGMGNFNWPGSARYIGSSSDSATRLAVGDVEGDGDLDIVAATTGPEVVYLNDGVANFPLTYTFGTGSATRLALGDLNGDGAVDVAGVGVPNVVYLNDGAGNFPDSAAYTRTFGSGMDTLALGDVDNDGDLDLVTGDRRVCPSACFGGQDLVYLNDGAANFGITQNFGTGMDNTYSVAVGDLDGDGDLDIVSGNGERVPCGVCGEPNVIYLNDGTGAFPNTAPYTRSFGTGEDNTYSVAVGDADGDGDLDIITGNRRNDTLTDRGRDVVYLNDGNGNFYSNAVTCGAAVNAICFSLGTETAAVALADFDNDGALDVVAGNDGEQSAVYLNNGAAQFSFATDVGRGNDFALKVVAGDFDGDLDLDVVVDDLAKPTTLFLNDGLGHYPVTRTVGGASFAADFTGDGALDIVGGTTLYVNDGAANFPTTHTIGLAVTGIGDLNGDGALDVVGIGAARLNDGAGNFSYTRTLSFGPDLVGDLDRDGDLDLVALDGTLGAVYLNDGDGYFGWPGSVQPFGTLYFAGRQVLGDVDGDGALDLVTVNTNNPHVVYLNDGQGNFGWPDGAREFGNELGNVWHHTQAVAVGDVDGDGDIDIVTGNVGDFSTGFQGCYTGEQSAVYLNDGLGHFDWYGSARTYGAGDDATTSVALGDTDGDGDVDIIAGRSSSDPNCSTGNLGGQNIVHHNGLARSIRLPNNPPRTAFLEPNQLFNANFVYTNPVQRDLVIPMTYTLADSENDSIRFIRAYFSPDGGGQWYSATAASGTLTQNLSTLWQGYGLALRGVLTDYVEIPSFTSFPTTAATVEFWMKSDDAANNGTPFSYAVSGSDNEFLIFNYQDFQIYVSGSPIAATGISANDGEWHHLAVTWRSSDGRLRLFKDGVQVFTSTLATGQTLITGGTLIFGQEQDSLGGGFQNGQAFNGALDEVRVWNVERTPAQILDNLNVILTGTQAGLVGHYRFLEGRGDRANDLTPTNNFGTLLGQADWALAAQTYVYNWDIGASGFFGQSDNVVFRLEAYPGFESAQNSAPLFQRPFASATTLPFRARGTQVRVLSDALTTTLPVSNALVYRLPAGQLANAEPLADGAGHAFHTDGQGYLQGRGQLNTGDQLVALLPITGTDSYTRYLTSAAPTFTGLTAFTVITPGVQTLTVSAAQPLVLFNLDVSLEWDARLDTSYLAQLEFNLQKASDYLYDATNGQAALGQLDFYFDKDHWDTAHLRVYANNRLRPFAAIGGVVSEPITDPVTSTVIYVPGQLHMAATWNRYGNPGVTLGEDWPRTLAHELGHYLFFQDDNYLGLDANNKLIPISTCLGTLMSDPYRDDYSEFKLDSDWLPGCVDTLANKTTGRSDWATIQAFYPLSATVENLGPTVRPLSVTRIEYVYPVTLTTALADPRFYLTYNGASYQPGKGARAFLLKSDRLVDLGSPVVDQVLARGAALAPISDTVCVFEPTANRQGCKLIVNASDQQLPLISTVDWQPDIIITPVSTRTVSIQVSHVPTTGLTLTAKVYANTGPVSNEQPLTLVGDTYTTTFTFSGDPPVLGGYVYVRVSSDPAGNQRASITEYTLGGNPANARSGFANARSGFANARSGFAPVVSGDGQVILYTPGITFPVETFYAVQAATYLPDVPGWVSVVGKGYRILASEGAPDMSGASMSLSYAKSDVPLGGEPFLRVYAYDAISQTWAALTSTVNVTDSSVVASLNGPGLYAVMTAIEIPLYGPGWNLVAYPIQGARPVTEATQSISGYFTTLYGYVVTDTVDPWKLYDVNVPGWVNDLYVLEYGHGYWLTATTDIIWRLNGEPSSPATGARLAAVPEQASAFGLPPATYYGVVRPSESLNPAPDMSVTAYVGSVLCGQGGTFLVQDQVVYSVNVSAAGSDVPGCGQPGAIVTFRLGTLLAGVTARWDNHRPLQLDLSLGTYVYLPVILE